jgi:hypothetical protein
LKALKNKSSSSSSSSAHHSPLLDIGLSKFSPSRSILGYSHPAPASRPAQVVTPPGLVFSILFQSSFDMIAVVKSYF